MRRPFLVAAVMSIAAVYLSLYAYAYIVIIAGILIFAGFLIYLKHTRIPGFYVLFIMMFPIMCLRTKNCTEKLCYQGYLSDKTYNASVNGYIADIKQSENGCSVYIRNADIIPDSWGKPLKCGLIIYSEERFADPGDKVNVKVRLKDFNVPSNEGQFNSRKYYTSLGFNYCADLSEIVKIQTGSSYISSIYRFADSVKNIYKNTYSEQNAGIMQSIVLGDRSGLDDDVKRMYQKNGISHILAISALHVSLVGMFIYDVLKKRMGRIASACVSTFLIISYLCMTGYSASASRAVIMILVYMLADVLGRTSDMANTLGIASVILLWINPFNITNAAFWMSFLAMAGIIFIKPLLSDDKTILIFVKRPDKRKAGFPMIILFRIADSVITGLCVTIGTLPVVLIISGQIPIISLLLNIIVIPLMSVIMISGIFTGIAGMFSLEAAYFFAGAGGYILDFYDKLCSLSSHFKYSVIVTGTPDTMRVVLYFIVLIIWICAHIILKNKRIDAVCFVLLVCVMTGLHYNINSDMKIAMLDVGQGDSIAMHTKDGMNVLFDGGSTSKKNVGRYTIYAYLKYCGVRRLDYVFISHPDKDHVNGIYELVELCDNTFEIGAVVLPGIKRVTADGKQAGVLVSSSLDVSVGSLAGSYAGSMVADDGMPELEEKLRIAGIKVVYADAGDCIKSGKFSVKCMHPCEGYDYESANDYSAVYLVEYGDFSMLMTGDAEKKAEKCIVEDAKRMAGAAGEAARPMSVNILKVGHHGSKGASSEEFLSYVKPETALISCMAGNSYGHPHTETLQRLSGIGAKVYRTDESGEIVVHVRNGSYKVEVFGALKG